MPVEVIGVLIGLPGTYLLPIVNGNLTENLSLSISTVCWYSISIVIVSPGAILAILVVNILGRCCSISEAFLPAFLAWL